MCLMSFELRFGNSESRGSVGLFAVQLIQNKNINFSQKCPFAVFVGFNPLYFTGCPLKDFF